MLDALGPDRRSTGLSDRPPRVRHAHRRHWPLGREVDAPLSRTRPLTIVCARALPEILVALRAAAEERTLCRAIEKGLLDERDLEAGAAEPAGVWTGRWARASSASSTHRDLHRA